MPHPFTDQLHIFIKRRNLPLEQVANLANLSRKTIYRWMNGEVSRPRHWSQVVEIGAALRLSAGELDQLLYAARCQPLAELKAAARYEYELEAIASFEAATPLAAPPAGGAPPAGRAQPPQPRAHTLPWATLETPAGAVRPESPYYIERDADEQLRAQLSGAGTTTTIQAGRQAGKTSLLMQAIHTAKSAAGQVIYLDFQIMEDDARAHLPNLLQHMSEAIAEQLDLDWARLDEYWANARNPTHTFNRFLQREVLQPAAGRVLLAIDEADLLLDAAYKKHFFALLRAWDSRRAFDEHWQKLNLVIVISTQPYLLIDDVNLSPFNVGQTLRLRDFTAQQVAELNRRHGEVLTPAELPALMDLVGGHPYLVRQALYTLAREGIGLAGLQAAAAQPDGPFGRHLQFYRHSLARSPALETALRAALAGKPAADETLLERLAAVGLLRHEGGDWLARCGLYQQFFG
jgi:predicted DNA-binding transcriptional regulator AlpA